MSSKGGPRARGTDGGDFGHREKVASHYQISSSNKKKLKVAMGFHFIAILFILLKLSTEISLYFDIPIKKFVNVTLPASTLWEKIWLSSILFTLSGYFACRKNNPTAMKIYAMGTFICGILPLIVGILYHSTDFKTFVLSEKGSSNVEMFYGVPVVLILSVFISFTFLIHSLSIMFAMNLIRAWTPKAGKKKS